MESNKHRIKPGDRIRFTNGYGYPIAWAIHKVNGTTVEAGGDTRSLDKINAYLDSPEASIDRGYFRKYKLNHLKHTLMKIETYTLEGVTITKKILRRGKPKIEIAPAKDLQGENLNAWLERFGVFYAFLTQGTLNLKATDLERLNTDELKIIIEICSGLDIATYDYNRLTAEYANRTLELKKPTV